MDNLSASQSHFDLKTLLDTSRLLVESQDTDFIVNNLLLIAMGKMMSPRAMVMLYDPVRSRYFIAKTKGKLKFKSGEEFSASEEFEKENGDITPTTLLTDDSVPATLRYDGITIMFNIRTSERHLGYLCLGNKVNGQPLAEAEKEFLESLVFMSAVALGNSMLVKEIRLTNRHLDLKVQEMHTLFELSKEFNAAIDRNQILRIFKFALLGQMLVRTFFMVARHGKHNELIASSGIKKEPTQEDITKLSSFNDTIVVVDDRLREEFPYLKTNNIEVLIRLNFYEGQPAWLGLGKRGGGHSYKEYDFSFLISLGNLVLLSLQKAFLLEEQLEKKRIEEELNLARAIQQKLLPDMIPSIDGLDMAAINIPSSQVGGDYYDLIANQHNLYLAIADVTGKGAPASLLMANLQAMLHILIPLNIDLKEATGKINSIIYQNTASDKFVSFFWGKLDVDSKIFTYVNAGHNPPYLFNIKNKSYEELSTGGMLLGAMPTIQPYSEGSVRLGKDDILVFFTDGVTEAMNSNEEEYAETRLKDCIWAHSHQESDKLLKSIIEDVKAFCNNRLGDDLTLMVVKGI